MREYGINQISVKSKEMGRYILKTKNGEVINHTTQINKEDSIEYFSKVKDLPIKVLLKIYKVEEDEDRYND